MEKQKQMILDEQSVEKIKKLKSLKAAFNETEFLLVINNENNEDQSEYLLTIPIEVMHQVVSGLYATGLEYQKFFNREIGFLEKEV